MTDENLLPVESNRRREFYVIRENDPSSLIRYWQILWRHKGALFISIFLCTLAVFLFSRLQTPVYQSTNSLEIQAVNEPSLNTGDLDANAKASEALMSAYIQTQIEILSSRALIGRVISKLRLEERPEFIEKRGGLGAWRKVLWLPPRLPVPQREYALAVVRENLRITAPRGSHLIRIEYSSIDRTLAADLANALAQEFIDQNLELRLRSTQRTNEWLNQQLDDLKAKLEESEDRLHTYGRASGLMFTSENDSVAEAKLKQVQEELSRAQADRIAKQSRQELVKKTPADSLQEVVENGPFRDYQVKLADVQRQLADLQSYLTPNHYKVKQLQAQIAELESALQRERSHVTERIASSYESAKRREQLLLQTYFRQAALVSELDAKGIQYKILKREVDTNRKLYEAILQRVKESNMVSAMRASNIVVFDPAVIPSRPYKPNLLLNSSLGLVSGIFLGVVLVFVLESADRSLKLPGDSVAYLKVPELGVIPSANKDTAFRRAIWTKLPAGQIEHGRREEAAAGSVELVTWRRTRSPLAESFRATLASILFAEANGTHPRVIVFTSASPGEGKTTAVSNLGIALARINHRVLLIDGDMRRPRLHRIFSLSNNFGLSDLLADGNRHKEYSLEAMAQETEVPNLCVLPSGSPTASPSDLLYSPLLPDLLRRFREEFDAVLIDTPPVLHLADTRVFGRLADAAILVCRAGETNRDSARGATERLAADGTPVLGTILNDWEPSITGYYEYYRSQNG